MRSLILFAVLFLVRCGASAPTDDESFQCEHRIDAGCCTSDWAWCLITEPDGGMRIIGGP